eukprot:280670_1
MPVVFGKNKRKLSTKTIIEKKTLGEPERKRPRIRFGKLEKKKLQKTLTSSNNPSDFANIFRAERINLDLGKIEFRKKNYRTRMSGDNSNNTNNNSRSNKNEADDSDIEMENVGNLDKIKEILGKHNVENLQELREAAAKAANEADDLVADLGESEGNTYEKIMKEYKNNIPAAARFLGTDNGNIKVRVIVLKKMAELGALEAIERITEIEMVNKMKKQMKEKEKRAEQERILAEE